MDNLDKFLPDFGELLALIETIKVKRVEKMLKELEIKDAVANIYKVTSTDEKYFVGGKAPSAVYVKNTWEHTGFDNEVSAMRKQLVELTAESALLENKFSIARDMVDVWRTLSANERITTV